MNFGVLLPLLDDPSINEIMVNQFDRIFIEKHGKLLAIDASFKSEREYEQLIIEIVKSRGLQISREIPCIDTYLQDGSRVNIVAHPMAVGGHVLTIRKFIPSIYSLNDLVQLGTLTERCAYFLELCIKSKANILISGGTSSGKTTFLNALAQVIPEDERIITIEDTPELQLKHRNWVRLKPVSSLQGEKISVRDCLVNALRMRPDRIIVGECRKNETFEMLQAMNTGHSGSLTTIHANSPRDCLSRLESLVLSYIDFPIKSLRKQIVSAINIIVQLRRDKSGERIVTDVIELTGTEESAITAQWIFALNDMEQAEPTGLTPKFYKEIQECGLTIKSNLFDPKEKFLFKK